MPASSSTYSPPMRAFQILVMAKTMACQALEHTVFIYDQDSEQEVGEHGHFSTRGRA